MDESYCCPICSPTAFGIVSVPDFGYPNRHIGRYLVLIYISPDDTSCAPSFHMLTCHLHIFGKMSLKVFGPLLTKWFVFLLLTFLFKFYSILLDNTVLVLPYLLLTLKVVFMFWIIVLYQICLLQIFSLDTIFHRAEVLNFYQLQLINRFFSYMMYLVLYFKKHCRIPGIPSFLLCYFLRNFILLFLIYIPDLFWVNFCIGCKLCV